MATRTTNYGLYKPDPTDNFGDFLPEFNANMDEIDNNLGDGGGDSVAWTQIQQSGTKIAEIEINGVTTDVYAPQGAPPFTALIIITADTGSTITATKGADTYTATEVTTGQYEVTVDSIGTWTISDGTLSDTVTVTAQTTYYVTLSAVPDGRTVLPTDDIQIWLNCADIWDKTYTALAEVLADTTTLLALINSPNAVDYMVRSTTWASGLTANSTAMSYIGLNNYCANTLLADSTWCNAICNSEYFESVLNVKVPTMTSNTTPEGICSCDKNFTQDPAWHAFDNNTSTQWSTFQQSSPSTGKVRYMFISPKVIRKMRAYIPYDGGYRARDYKINASSDGVTYQTLASGTFTSKSQTSWEDVVFSNSTQYQYWELEIDSTYSGAVNVKILQFYGREDV